MEVHIDFRFPLGVRSNGAGADIMDAAQRVIAPFGSDGLVVGLVHEGEMLAFICPAGRSGYSCPDFLADMPNEAQFAVGSSGDLYLVTWEAEPRLERLDYFAISGTCAIPAASLRVFANLTHLIGVGPAGEVWKSPELGDDQIHLLGCDGFSAVVEAYSAEMDAVVTTRIDISDGSVRA